MEAVPQPSLTACGWPGISQIPYGTHMCHFYEVREDLVAALVPFFAAGLASNERCIWITAEPLGAEDARVELAKAGLDVYAAIRSGALTVRDYSEWYRDAGDLQSRAVAALWLAEEARALKAGYHGLRISGNASFVTPETWPDFMDYEEIVHRAFQGRRIISLCTYHRERCEPEEMPEVIRRHSCALEHPAAGSRIRASPGL